MLDELGEHQGQTTGGRDAAADVLQRSNPPISAAGALEIVEATCTLATAPRSAEALWLPETGCRLDLCV